MRSYRMAKRFSPEVMTPANAGAEGRSLPSRPHPLPAAPDSSSCGRGVLPAELSPVSYSDDGPPMRGVVISTLLGTAIWIVLFATVYLLTR